MKAGMAILKPLLAETGAPRLGKLVIGTVKGDIHDIGKNLVIMMMEGAGFEVRDLGLSLIHISEPTRLRRISYAVFCLKKKISQFEGYSFHHFFF